MKNIWIYEKKIIMYYMKTLHKIYSFTTLHNTIYTNELCMNNEINNHEYI